MSVALRTYLLQTLMLPTDEKDPDADYHERQVVAPDVVVPDGFLDLVAEASTLDGLQSLWHEAVKGGFSKQIQAVVTKRKGELA
jgi:hypothetical protein